MADIGKLTSTGENMMRAWAEVANNREINALKLRDASLSREIHQLEDEIGYLTERRNRIRREINELRQKARGPDE